MWFSFEKKWLVSLQGTSYIKKIIFNMELITHTYLKIPKIRIFKVKSGVA